MIHDIQPSREAVRGYFDRDLPPALTVDPGDTVRFRTLDSGWGYAGQKYFGLAPEVERDPELDWGHALTGPIAIRGAEPGDALGVYIERLQPGTWGFSHGGPEPWPGANLSIDGDAHIGWRIDVQGGTARDTAGLGLTVPIRPFMGVMGNAPAEAGRHSTVPPRRVGGNLDCRELVAGSVLWLPVEVPGALFSVGDGHAVQGDGEVGRVALECPMDLVELRFEVRKGSRLERPETETPAGYITLGWGETLDDAVDGALNGMLDHLQHVTGLDRAAALSLASLVVDLHVTQMVNGVKGVHAILPPRAFSIGAQTV